MKNNFSCIIVDDERDAVELLSDRIGHLYPNIVVATAKLNWGEALRALKENKYDLVFMDISLPGKNGIDLLKLVPQLESEIIFVTAHEEYALNAFSLAATGYILKPIDDEFFTAAVDKALERIENKRLATGPRPISTLSNKIGIPNKNGVDYVNVRDIIFLESTNKCTKVVTASAVYVSSQNLGKFKEVINDDSFFQVHRSYIVNLNFVLRYESTGVVILSNKMEIPVSRNVKNEFLKIFNNNC